MANTLHILPVSPWSGDAFDRCSRALEADDSLLLIGDGVYAARTGSAMPMALPASSAVRIYALGEDCVARGLDTLCTGVRQTDYAGFVALATEHARTVTWL